MWESTRNRVKFVTEPISPELDIHPTNECKIEVREIDTWDENTKRQGRSTTACIYRGDGRCVGTITRERLTTLRQLYDRANELGYHSTMTPPPRSFEAEMVDLITRYKPRNKSHCEWRLPPPTRDCLNKHFTSHIERFANPLTAPDACTPYWSDHERDRVFGAHTGRYKYQWTGFSHALLPADAPATDKAIHWALWSATHTLPIPLPLSCPSPKA